MTAHRSHTSGKSASLWPHRLAWLLACATFLLINVGGTVTTLDEGMAVSDWPTTRGELFYPLTEWLASDRGVFWEHGHRMLGMVVGILVLVLAAALWWLDPRKWIRWLGLAALAAVMLQGVLGGIRVLGEELLLAKVHGCTAPLFFAFCASLVTLTSRPWQQADGPQEHPAAAGLQRLATVLTVALYLQIVLGAQLRHLPPESRPGWFVLWVWLKLIAAGLNAVGVLWLLVYLWRRPRTDAVITRRAGLLAVLFFLELVLGAGTWVTNYGFPAWFRDYIWAAGYNPAAGGPLQVITTTAHAAVGSLSFVAALSVTLWSRRLLRGRSR